MTFHDLKDMDKDDILGALGLQTKGSTTGWVLGTLGVFGVGLLVGASMALLMAPKSGRELRQDLTHRFRRGEESIDGRTLEGAV